MKFLNIMKSYKPLDSMRTNSTGGGWWTSKIKDASQLDEVFEYYEKQQ